MPNTCIILILGGIIKVEPLQENGNISWNLNIGARLLGDTFWDSTSSIWPQFSDNKEGLLSYPTSSCSYIYEFFTSAKVEKVLKIIEELFVLYGHLSIIMLVLKELTTNKCSKANDFKTL